MRYYNANKFPNILIFEILNNSPRTTVLSDENLTAPSCLREHSEPKYVQIFKIILIFFYIVLASVTNPMFPSPQEILCT